MRSGVERDHIGEFAPVCGKWATASTTMRAFGEVTACLKESNDFVAPSAPHERGGAHAEPWSGGGTSLNALGAHVDM
jgi:hypothetical protein